MDLRFFIYFLKLKKDIYGHIPGKALNISQSCNLCQSCGNARSLIHWTRLGIESTPPQRPEPLIRFLTHWATTVGTLDLCFFFNWVISDYKIIYMLWINFEKVASNKKEKQNLLFPRSKLGQGGAWISSSFGRPDPSPTSSLDPFQGHESLM